MKHILNYSISVLSLIASASVWSACLDSGMQLQILGSGGPGASGGRASAAYLLWIDGVGRIMVDAGSGTKDQFYRSGANLDDIELVALSHLHSDHSVELPRFSGLLAVALKFLGHRRQAYFHPLKNS